MDKKNTYSKTYNKLAASTFGYNLQAIIEHIAAECDIDQDIIMSAVKSFDTKKFFSHKKKKKNRLDGEPERARTAYVFFSKEMRNILKEEEKRSGNKLDFSNTGKEIGKRWKELSETEKNKYVTLAEEDKIRYTKQMMEYNPSYKAKQTKKIFHTEIDKHLEGIKEAGERSNNSEEIYCYNVTTGRLVKFLEDKQGDKVWLPKQHFCASNSDDFQKWKHILSENTTKIVVEIDDLSDSETAESVSTTSQKMKQKNKSKK